jgi:DUF971 family protein
MRPKQIELVGEDLAIKWENDTETFIRLTDLRQSCPCAACKGETDIMGNVSRGPQRPLTAEAFQVRRIGWVGGYGIQPYWADGHSSGIFSFEQLKSL